MSPGFLKKMCSPPPPVRARTVWRIGPCACSSARNDSSPPWRGSTSRTASPAAPVAIPRLARGERPNIALMRRVSTVASLNPLEPAAGFFPLSLKTGQPNSA